jgi:hypothetical protein
MAPGKLGNSLLRDFGRPGLSEGGHAEQVSLRQAPHVGELGSQVGGETVDDLGAPALRGLTFPDGPP